MSILREIFASQISEAIGWTILHSVWQAGVIGLIAFALLKLRQNSTASYRYSVSILSLFAILLSSAFTFLIIYRSAANVYVSVADKMRISTSMLTQPGTGATNQGEWAQLLPPLLPWLSTLWFTGVLFFSIRFAGGLLLLQRYRNHLVADLPAQMAEKIHVFIKRSGITRKIRVRISEMVRVPMVTGILKPVILIPAGIISLLPVEQIEAVIAHELAHIRRYDFLINILQTLTETLFFYHPAVWLLSSNARAEREKCCDDYAVQACGDLGVYAKALANLSGFRLHKPLPAMAFSGKKLSLVNRVERLLNSNKMKSNAKERVIAGILILGSAIVLTLSTGAAPVLKLDLNLLERVKPVSDVEAAESAEVVETIEAVEAV